MNDTRKRIKFGWILLLVLFLYSIFMTQAFQRTKKQLTNLHNTSTSVVSADANMNTNMNALSADMSAVNTDTSNIDNIDNTVALQENTQNSLQEATLVAPVTFAEAGLWMPIVGARVPQNPMWLPTAPRTYRLGESQGFDFYSDDAGVAIAYGTPVIASNDAKVIRIDTDHEEFSREQWDELLAQVGINGANEEQLDVLRGRQIWLETRNGQILRYAHLSSIRNGIEVNQDVYRGQVIGYVGNSGTDNAIKGDTRGARLHFEVWESGDKFFGQGLDIEDVKIQAPRLFVGP